MHFYALLTVITALLLVLTLRLWVTTRNLSFVLGAFYLYYWTLQGAWVLVHDKLHDIGGASPEGYNYGYLEERLFPIELNAHYFETILIYSFFLTVVLITVNFAVRRHSDENVQRPLLYISHARLLAIAVAAGGASFLMIRGELSTAATLDYSGYSFTRGADMMASVRWFSLHQMLYHVALVSTGFGIAILCSGPKQARFLTGKRSPTHVAAYIAVAVALVAFMAVLGNRADLMSVSAAAVLFYIANCRRVRYVSIAALIVLVIVAANAIEVSRGVPIRDIPAALMESKPWDFSREQTSNEQFAAHFSLYGCLQYDIPPSYGSSIASFAASLVPRIIWPNRPDNIYAHYAKSINAYVGQGYTIHHATGWYLNFGLPGVFVGAILLGLVWARCFNGFYTAAPNGGLLHMTRLVAPWTFVGHLAQFVRAGPEGYKSLLVEALFVPSMILLVSKCAAPVAASDDRPVPVFGRAAVPFAER